MEEVALGEALETGRGMIGEESRFQKEAKISTVFQGNTQGRERTLIFENVTNLKG